MPDNSKFDLPTQPQVDDNLYPNQGESYLGGEFYPGTPEERVEAEKTEQNANAIKAASYPVMPEIAKWFEEKIAECNNIDAIQATELIVNGTHYSRRVSIEAQVLAMQLLKGQLTSKYQEFKGFKEAEE